MAADFFNSNLRSLLAQVRLLDARLDRVESILTRMHAAPPIYNPSTGSLLADDSSTWPDAANANNCRVVINAVGLQSWWDRRIYPGL